MTTVSIELPETVFSALRRDPAVFVKEMRVEAATQWYAQQRISQEKGLIGAARPWAYQLKDQGMFVDAELMERALSAIGEGA